MIFRGKDTVTGFWVYGPLLIQDNKTYINDIECGLVPVEPESVKYDNEPTYPIIHNNVTRTASSTKETDNA